MLSSAFDPSQVGNEAAKPKYCQCRGFGSSTFPYGDWAAKLGCLLGRFTSKNTISAGLFQQQSHGKPTDCT